MPTYASLSFVRKQEFLRACKLCTEEDEVQLNLANTDTQGTEQRVCIREVSV